MRILFILLCTISSIAKSQDQSILGKWKVVALNNGTYFDYKDSASSTKHFLNSLKDKKDSSESFKLFLRTISLYRDYYIVFNKDGTYNEAQGSMTLGTTSQAMELSGTYELNFAHMHIELLRNNKKSYYSLKFIKNGIKLYYLADGFLSSNNLSDFILTLERSK